MAQPAYVDGNDDLDLTAPWERAIEGARHGQVVWLSEYRRRKFAVLPAELAEAALEALEDAEDLEAIRQARAEGGEPIPWEEVKAELRDLEAQGR